MAILEFTVVPRSSCNKFVKEEDRIKLKITAPPVDGAANKQICEFVAKYFDCPKREITLISGQQSKKKRLSIACITQEEMEERLQKDGLL